MSFFAGWGLSLDYIITVAISAFFVPHYLSVFFPALGHGPGDVIGGAGVIAILALLNIRGIGESTRVNVFLAVTDLLTQVALVGLGAVRGPRPVAARKPGTTWASRPPTASSCSRSRSR